MKHLKNAKMVFKYLAAALFLAVLAATPVQAQVKWKHGLLDAKADAGFFWMAKEKGFFKKHGLDVEFIEFRGDKDIIRAMLAGELDSADGTPITELNAIDRGADLRFLGSSMPGLTYALYVNKDIASWDQLKGKTFGVSAPGGQQDIISRDMLARKGVDAESIKLAPSGSSATTLQALIAGKIDATAASSQFVPDADKLGIKVMALAGDIVPEFPRFAIVAQQATLKAKREATINFLAGYMEGLDYAVRHRDETLSLSAKMNNKPANNPQLVYIVDEVIAKGHVSIKLEVPQAKIDWLQGELLKMGDGAIRKKIDLNKFVDESYRKEALKRVSF